MLRRYVLVLSVVLAASIICGCITVTVHSKVDRSGNLADYNMTLVMPNFYGKKMNITNSSKVDTTVKKLKQSGATVTEKTYMTNSSIVDIIDIKNLNPSKLNNSSEFKIKILKEGNYLIYYDYTFTKNNTNNTKNIKNTGEMPNPNEVLSSMIKVNYYLEMPGKIVDSNADKVKGNKAEWHFSSRKTPIYAKCEVPKSPGFEILGVLLAIIGVVVVLNRNRF